MLGYDDTAADINHGICGIGNHLGDSNITSLTTSEADFTSGQHIKSREKYIFIVKKNKSVLEKLIYFLTPILNDSNYPTLIIDDEADQASINTQDKPDEETDPSTINRLIREIIHLSKRTSYVYYTATPFANVFINDQFDENSFKDLFPSDFILTLNTPKQYTGYKKFFKTYDEAPFLQEVPNYEHEQIAHQIKNENIRVLPSSLKVAILNYILASVIKRARKSKEKHNSMLIHVSHLNNVQSVLNKLVNEYIENEVKYMDDEIFYDLWQEEYQEFSSSIGIYDDWNAIKQEISQVLDDITIKEINSAMNDTLVYGDEPVTVITIGGNKLSRGLMLEGLHTSYYLRFSKTYDTLMQMSRWFGYREETLDLCRVYSTSDNFKAFIDIFETFEELKELFNNLYEANGTPQDYELKIKYIDGLLPTNSSKMRRNLLYKMNMSNARKELTTYSFNDDNIDNTKRWFTLLEKKYNMISNKHTNESLVFERVHVKDILMMLSEFKTKEDGADKISKWVSFINEALSVGELERWNVAFFNGSNSNIKLQLTETASINASNRLTSSVDDHEVSIRSQIVGRDLFVDYYNEEELVSLAEANGSGLLQYLNKHQQLIIDNNIRPDHKGGLLLIYYNNLTQKMYDKKEDLNKQIIGIGLKFPKLNNEDILKSESYFTKSSKNYSFNLS